MITNVGLLAGMVAGPGILQFVGGTPGSEA